MNIHTNQINDSASVNVLTRAKALYESFHRCQNLKQFLLEHGDTMENRAMYAFIGLNEAYNDKNAQFTFENGMSIPGLNYKSDSKYTLSGISKHSANAEEFIKTVDSDICQKFLQFSLSDKDKENLTEAYMKTRL